VFTTGTDTIISITNVTPQSMFPTDPGLSTVAGGYGQSLGIFRSNSDIFTEKELTNPINNMSVASGVRVPNWSSLGAVDLPRSQLLKGLVLRIDEDIDYGVLQRDNSEDPALTDEGWVAYFPDPYTGTGDPNGYNEVDHRAAVPNETSIPLAATRPTAGTTAAYQEASVTTFRLTVRDTRQRFHIGPNEDQVVIAEFGNMTAEALGLTIALRSDGHKHDGVEKWENGRVTDDYAINTSIETQDSAERAITIFDRALKMVSEERAKYGAYQNSLEKRANYLNIAYENQIASESRIRDVDMAKEIADFTRNQILIQSGSAMLAQANLKPQVVLSLLG
jgi:flagellin-like hook-associated protein FlgL